MALTKILTEGIKDGEILNADINASAAIARTKLANVDVVDDTTPQLGGNLDVNTKNIVFGDSGSSSDDRLQFGASQDLNIFHDGTDSHIRNNEGKLIITQDDSGGDDLHLRAKANEESIICHRDGQVELYYNNSKKLETTSTGVVVSGKLETTGFLSVAADNQDLKVGAGDDIRIFHDGSSSRIYNATGDLVLRSASYYLNSANGSENIIKGIEDGAVELYYDNSKKFETFANGCKLYSNSGSARLEIQGGEGSGAWLQIQADDGDDNADYWRMYVGTNADFYLQNYKDGAWETNLDATGGGNIRLMYDNSLRLETLSEGINVKGTSSTTAQIKIHSQPAIGRSYWGYGGNQSYTGTSIGRTDSSTASTLFMGVDVTGNSGGNFGGLGSEIVFRRDHIFTTPNAANTNFVTCMRFGRATSTEGAVAFTNGLMFGNDQADANIIKDYEEGTYTPTFSTGMSGITYTLQYGNYIKVGNLVRFDFHIQVNGGVSNGAIIAFTLPFNSDAGVNGHRGSGVITYSNINDGNQGTNGFPALYIGTASAQCYMGGTAWSGSSGSSQSNKYFIGGGTYHTP